MGLVITNLFDVLVKKRQCWWHQMRPEEAPEAVNFSPSRPAPAIRPLKIMLE